MLRRLSIGRKVLLLVAVAELIMVVTGVIALRAQRSLQSSAASVASSVDVVRESVLADMAHDATRGDVLEALQAPAADRPAIAASADEHATELLTHLDAVAAGPLGDEVSAAVAALREDAVAYGQAARSLTTTAVDDPEGAAAMLGAFNDAFTALEQELPSVADAVVAAKDAEVARSESTAAAGLRSILIAQALAVLLLAGAAMAVGRSTLGPIRAVVTRLKQISSGDGDLTQRLDDSLPGELGALGREFNAFVAQLATAMRDVGERATMLAAASEELTAVSASMRAGATATAAHVDDALAAAAAVHAGVRSVDESAGQLGAAIREIAANASEAARVATDAVGSVDATAAAVDQLADRSMEISSVVDSISQIAQQTNLLALNATIEAARAGEAGRGFAVVASEVKELADETARATGDITGQVARVQADSRGAVGAISAITTVIGRINETQSMIAAAVEQQSATTAEIARAIDDAGRSSVAITAAVSDVRTAISITTDGARDNEQAARELASLATDLQQLVARFRY